MSITISGSGNIAGSDRASAGVNSDITSLAGVTTANAVPLLHHNDVINGDFRIAQAGTSFPAAVNGYYDLDGWHNGNNTAAVITVAQVAGSTTGSFARQVTVTTADTSIAVSDYVADVTRIEGYNIEKYVGKTFTISFRAKVPVAGIHCVALRNYVGDRAYIKEINFPTANTWQDCSFTVVGGLPGTGSWEYTNGAGLSVWFTRMAGTTFQTTPDAWQTGNFLSTSNQVNDCATVGNVWALEKVTLNLGTVAAVSEISVDQELALCQRYFVGYGPNAFMAVGSGQSSTYIYMTLDTKVPLRAVPTIAFTGDIQVYPGVTSVTSFGTIYPSWTGTGVNSVAVGTNVASGVVNAGCYSLYTNNGGITLSARL